MDRGANGGIAGSDVRVIWPCEGQHVDVSGIGSHKVTNLAIVTAGGVLNSQYGPVIAILHQYAYMGIGESIHSSGQLEWYKNDVNDRSMKVRGGLQRIKTVDGYVHPLCIQNGLPFIPMRPYTDDEWETLPRVVWTSDAEWDPSVLDHEVGEAPKRYDTISDMQDGIVGSSFGEFGMSLEHDNVIHFVDARLFFDVDGEIDGAIQGSINAMDNLSKRYGTQLSWLMSQLLLFLQGDLMELNYLTEEGKSKED